MKQSTSSEAASREASHSCTSSSGPFVWLWWCRLVSFSAEHHSR